jgi:hypothetical protein
MGQPTDKRDLALLRVMADLDANQPCGYFPLSQIVGRFRVGAFALKRLRTEAQSQSEASRALRNLYKRNFVRSLAGNYGLTQSGRRMAVQYDFQPATPHLNFEVSRSQHGRRA